MLFMRLTLTLVIKVGILSEKLRNAGVWSWIIGRIERPMLLHAGSDRV